MIRKNHSKDSMRKLSISIKTYQLKIKNLKKILQLIQFLTQKIMRKNINPQWKLLILNETAIVHHLKILT